MSVSGLGSARTPRSAVTPPTRPQRAGREPADRNDSDHLTAADRELIYQATGQRLGSGFDAARNSTTGFAAALAAERAAGRLAPGQEATAVYLKDLNRRYARGGGTNPVAPHLDAALAYLSRGDTRRFDVSA